MVRRVTPTGTQLRLMQLLRNELRQLARQASHLWRAMLDKQIWGRPEKSLLKKHWLTTSNYLWRLSTLKYSLKSSKVPPQRMAFPSTSSLISQVQPLRKTLPSSAKVTLTTRALPEWPSMQALDIVPGYQGVVHLQQLTLWESRHRVPEQPATLAPIIGTTRSLESKATQILTSVCL